ncbi:MAG: phytanoyl-CoA dioxygenase family protein [Armatimonadetes bacterium]|nr:phytanoyl-CoA dioxygenase family protein [Armatimonadota bacterium]
MILRMGERELELGGNYLGHLRDSTAAKHDYAALRERLAEDGYLLVRGLHDPAKVQAARTVLIDNLDSNNQIDRAHPLDEAVIAEGGRGQFLGGAKAISHHPDFLGLVESPELMEWFANLFGGPSLTFDYKWIRAIPGGAYSGAHYDVVYMGRGTLNLCTCWTPLGDVTYDMGPLTVLAGSNQWKKVQETYGRMDVDRDHVEGWFSKDPVELVDQYGGQWLTTEFQAGDAMIFSMFLMHGSLTNVTNRYRFSTDTRYQRADEPVDERWVGESPKAHYAWHQGEMKTMESARAEWGV